MVEPAGSRGSLAVVAVFALGVVLGAALAAAIAHAIGPSGSVPPLRVGPAAMERLARHLDLDPEQREKVRAILGRNRQKVRDLFEQTREEIRGSSGPNSRKHSTEFTRPAPDSGEHNPDPDGRVLRRSPGRSNGARRPFGAVRYGTGRRGIREIVLTRSRGVSMLAPVRPRGGPGVWRRR